jgi:hypothetical protein
MKMHPPGQTAVHIWCIKGLSGRFFHPADQSFSIRRSAERGLALSVMKQDMTQDGAAAVAELGQCTASVELGRQCSGEFA